MRNLFTASRLEILATAAAALAFAALAFLLWVPAETAQGILSRAGMAFFLGTSFLLPLLFLLALLLGVGLGRGFLRHRDFSPLFFAFLGVSMLFLAILTGLSPLLPLLCGVSILLAGIWSLTAPSTGPFDVTTLPGLDEFMDASAAPPDAKQ